MNEITQGENSAPLVRLNKSPPIFRALTVKSENTSELSSHLVIRQWKVINLQRGSKRTGERERESRETLINGAYKALPPPYPLLLRPWTTAIHGCVPEGRALRFFRGRARCFNHPKFFFHTAWRHTHARGSFALFQRGSWYGKTRDLMSIHFLCQRTWADDDVATGGIVAAAVGLMFRINTFAVLHSGRRWIGWEMLCRNLV